jgi:hypothetical protein
MMATIVEFDESMNRIEGREAISAKIRYIVHVLKGDIPYSDLGLPVQFFSFDNPELSAYIDGRFRAAGIQAQTKLTSAGRLTVYDTDVLFEGDL